MTYQETLNYLYTQLPMYQREGTVAFKKDLTNIIALCAHLQQPHTKFKSVHIAGTNGKGSTSHIIAAFLQTAGYKVGLYTSPHYKDFRERIKINGKYIPEKNVIEFVAKNKIFFEQQKPSFFEMTVAMAFEYFANEKVDIAIIETGLGGRLDSTNIIQPLFSLITNIGMDHQAMLGDTIELIAGEKAGIIKHKTPVIIGESHPESEPVFNKKAFEEEAAITFADMRVQIEQISSNAQSAIYQIKSDMYPELNFDFLDTDLVGNYQKHNLRNALMAWLFLQAKGFEIEAKHIRAACLNIRGISNLIGRWQSLGEHPTIIADSAHNEDGLKYVIDALNQIQKDKLHIVLGVVNDKDLSKILPKLPTDAIYYFCKANIPRGLPANELMQEAFKHNLNGNYYESVNTAFEAAKKEASPNDCIFIGGSIFTVAEVV